MSRLTDSLPGPGNSDVRYPQRAEAKSCARRALSESGTTFEKVARATGRSISVAWDLLNVGNDRRHMTYADLIAMSRHTATRLFVAHLLQPIEQNMKGPTPTASPAEGKPDGHGNGTAK